MGAELVEEFSLVGDEVELDDVERLKVRGMEIVDTLPGPIYVDMAELVRSNSVTVALLVVWYRRATLQEKSIFFMNLSEELHNIVEFSGLSQVLLNPTSGL